jgi:maleate cis-trans isomerase
MGLPVETSAVVRIGTIVPSSNTVLEDELARLAPADGPVAVHVTRVRVTEISLGAAALA